MKWIYFLSVYAITWIHQTTLIMLEVQIRSWLLQIILLQAKAFSEQTKFKGGMFHVDPMPKQLDLLFPMTLFTGNNQELDLINARFLAWLTDRSIYLFFINCDYLYVNLFLLKGSLCNSRNKTRWNLLVITCFGKHALLLKKTGCIVNWEIFLQNIMVLFWSQKCMQIPATHHMRHWDLFLGYQLRSLLGYVRDIVHCISLCESIYKPVTVKKN